MVSASELETLTEAERQGWLSASKARLLRAENERLKEINEAQAEQLGEAYEDAARLRALIHNTIEQRWFDYEAAEKILNQQIASEEKK